MSEKITNPLPGAYSVDFQTYRSWRALNASLLKCATRSWQHFRCEALSIEATDSPDLLVGRALHAMLLEPDWAAKHIHEKPSADRRTVAGREAHTAFEASVQAGDILLTEGQMTDCCTWRTAMLTDATARRLLVAPGTVEVSLLWSDEDTGVECKARLDKLIQTKGGWMIVDIKTAKDASPEGFGKACIQHGYDIQAAHYMAGVRAVKGDNAPVSMVFVVIEKASPWCVQVYSATEPDVSPDLATFGETRRRKLLREYVGNKRADKWPGYAEGIVPVRVPAWHAMRMEAVDE